jgi:hypothetical protein
MASQHDNIADVEPSDKKIKERKKLRKESCQ